MKNLEKSPFPHRFMAIEGNIGAGKTTLCNMLAADFGCDLLLEQFTDNPFLPFFYENSERYGFPVELFFMTERHKQLQEHFAEPDLFSETTIADYFFVKTLLFAKNNLNDEEYRLFQRLWQVLNQTFPRPDVLFYLHRPVEILLAHIEKRGRDYEKNISPDYLTSIQNAYFDYFKSEQNVPIVVINLANHNYLEDNSVYLKLTEILSKSYENGTHFLTV
jgi:deoxyguanosine kinase